MVIALKPSTATAITYTNCCGAFFIMTAVEWFYEKIKSHFEQDGDLLETLTITMAIAKKKERDQHGNTWDAAIKAHDERGHVFVRSTCDFDDYEIS